jgi:hypothetical protein
MEAPPRQPVEPRRDVALDNDIHLAALASFSEI